MHKHFLDSSLDNDIAKRMEFGIGIRTGMDGCGIEAIKDADFICHLLPYKKRKATTYHESRD